MFAHNRYFPFLVLLISFAFVLQACDMNSSSDESAKEDSFSDLTVSDDFNWSNSKHVDIDIQFPDRALVNTALKIYAEEEQQIARLNVLEDGITFEESIPSYIETLRLVNPATGHSQTINAESGTVVFEGYQANKADLENHRGGDAQLFNTTSYFYHMFEDLWPAKGDYDFNDYVFRSVVEKELDANNKLVGAEISITVESMGAYFPYGLGVEVLRGTDATSTYLPTNIITFSGDAVAEAGASNVAIISENLKDVSAVTPRWNTFLERYSSEPTVFEYSINWDEDGFGSNNISLHYFLFSVDDRSREIHSVGNPPTALASTSELGTADDNSTQEAWDRTPGRQFSKPAPFYRTENFLPWGLTLQIVPGIEPAIPREKVDISNAYQQFTGWAQSEGTLNTTWWFFPDSDKVLEAPAP